MHVLEASYSLVTPLAFHMALTRRATITSTLFLSSLRTFWRMLAWTDPRFQRSIFLVEEEEIRLFGGRGMEEGVVHVHVASTSGQVMRPGETFRQVALGGEGEGLAFLGNGIWNLTLPDAQGNRSLLLSRSLLSSPGQLVVTCLTQESPDPLLVDALKLLGMIGGLGVRMRRGFGSLALQQLVHRTPEGLKRELFEKPTHLTAYANLLRKLMFRGHRSLPPIPALSQHTRVVMLAHDTQPMPLLEKLGSRLERFRDRLRYEHAQGRMLDYLDPQPFFRLTERRPWRRTYGSATVREAAMLVEAPTSETPLPNHELTLETMTPSMESDGSAEQAQLDALLAGRAPEEPTLSELNAEPLPGESHAAEAHESRPLPPASSWPGARPYVHEELDGLAEPDHRVGGLCFHIHQLGIQQFVAVVACYPCEPPCPDYRSAHSHAAQALHHRMRYLEHAALEEYVTGHYHHRHPKRGQAYFPEAIGLVPELRGLTRSRDHHMQKQGG